MLAHEVKKKKEKVEQCQLYELVQYECKPTKTQIECSPFTRQFLKCAGAPTVEVTPEVKKEY
ncbi:hypothetical protein K501DRAFT_188273 [Backusella circina FSU 941]|nr:hypothetical protein K501DRAFT_188273 [Backusella circina FSU 941]